MSQKIETPTIHDKKRFTQTYKNAQEYVYP